MKEVLRITYRIGNEGGFEENRYLQEALRSVTDQTGLLHEARSWYFDTKKMGLLAEDRFLYCEQAEGSDEILLGESRQTRSVMPRIQRSIARWDKTGDLGKHPDPTVFGWEEAAGLKRAIQAHWKQRTYSLKGCTLIWQISEWALDEEKRAYHELQLRGEAGTEAEMLALACRLTRILRLHLETGSTEMRALRELGMAGEEGGTKVRAGEEPAWKWMSGLLLENSSALAIAMKRLEQIPDDVEALHQLRISLRTLRSALSFGRSLMPEQTYAAASGILRELGEEASLARDLSVLEASVRSVGEEEVSHVLKDLGAKREQAYSAVKAKLENGTMSASLTQFLSLVLPEEGWTEEARRRQAVNYRTMMRDAWLIRLIAKSQRFDMENVKRIHRLRILVKKLRYVLRSSRQKGDEERELVKLLGDLQDVLGEIHDKNQQRQILMDILWDDPDCQVRFEAGYYMGVWSSREDKHRRDLEEGVRKLLGKLRETNLDS